MNEKMKGGMNSAVTGARVCFSVSFLLIIVLTSFGYAQLSEDSEGWEIPNSIEDWLSGENSLGDVFPSLDAWHAEDNLFAQGVCTLVA